MRRLYRLLVPGLTFGALGALVLLLAPLPAFELRGGLVVTGAYALVLQTAVSVLLMTAIDDLQDRPLVSAADRRRWSMAFIAGTTDDLRRSLRDFYLGPALPPLLLGFGVAVTTTAVAFGLLDEASLSTVALVDATAPIRHSEIATAALLGLTAMLLLRRPGHGYYGWVLGFSAGCCLAQLRLDPYIVVEATLLGWLAMAVVLCLLRLLTSAVVRTHRRRRVLQP